eukprot:NODE_13072_length_1187_cov_2.016981.p2 GENE.NODE_13072_length_1187_cov_2.016981~~NODE_13072_length_1187_cov_2.016981.p2  ORF type:complete len:135 (+),score=20.49 NODE_13072_length_1187_cov_2.016981:433-837(+)
MAMYSCIVLYDDDVLYETEGSGCIAYADLVILASAEIVGAIVITPILDRKDLAFLGGRLGTQLLSYIINAVTFLLTGSSGSPVLLWASISRGLVSAGTGMLYIQTAECIDSKHRAPLTAFLTNVSCIGCIIMCY